MDVDAEPVIGREVREWDTRGKRLLTTAGRLTVCLTGALLVRLAAGALGIDLLPSPTVLNVVLAQVMAVIVGASLGLLWSVRDCRQSPGRRKHEEGTSTRTLGAASGHGGYSAPGDGQARSI